MQVLVRRAITRINEEMSKLVSSLNPPHVLWGRSKRAAARVYERGGGSVTRAKSGEETVQLN